MSCRVFNGQFGLIGPGVGALCSDQVCLYSILKYFYAGFSECPL